jgi:hypothetical protein
MAISKPATKDILIGVGLLAAFVVAMLLVLNIYRQEGEKRSAAISEEGEKDPDHIEAFVKLATPKKEEAAKPGEEEAVPVAVAFYGSIPGMKIEAAKSQDSDDDYVGIDMKIGRSSTQGGN